MTTRDLTIILPATERATILAALAVADQRADDQDNSDCTPSYRLHTRLCAWLRTELTGAEPLTRTRALNEVIKEARLINPVLKKGNR
jgi:hypothetical protein